jgi:hypothetical protein
MELFQGIVACLSVIMPLVFLWSLIIVLYTGESGETTKDIAGFIVKLLHRGEVSERTKKVAKILVTCQIAGQMLLVCFMIIAVIIALLSYIFNWW